MTAQILQFVPRDANGKPMPQPAEPPKSHDDLTGSSVLGTLADVSFRSVAYEAELIPASILEYESTLGWTEPVYVAPESDGA